MKRHYPISSIAHALDYLGVTQRDVAKRTEYSQSAISRCASDAWEDIEPYKVVEILEAISAIVPELGEFTIQKTLDGRVESVMFIRH